MNEIPGGINSTLNNHKPSLPTLEDCNLPIPQILTASRSSRSSSQCESPYKKSLQSPQRMKSMLPMHPSFVNEKISCAKDMLLRTKTFYIVENEIHTCSRYEKVGQYQRIKSPGIIYSYGIIPTTSEENPFWGISPILYIMKNENRSLEISSKAKSSWVHGSKEIVKVTDPPYYSVLDPVTQTEIMKIERRFKDNQFVFTIPVKSDDEGSCNSNNSLKLIYDLPNSETVHDKILSPIEVNTKNECGNFNNYSIENKADGSFVIVNSRNEILYRNYNNNTSDKLSISIIKSGKKTKFKKEAGEGPDIGIYDVLLPTEKINNNWIKTNGELDDKIFTYKRLSKMIYGVKERPNLEIVQNKILEQKIGPQYYSNGILVKILGDIDTFEEIVALIISQIRTICKFDDYDIENNN